MDKEQDDGEASIRLADVDFGYGSAHPEPKRRPSMPVRAFKTVRKTWADVTKRARRVILKGVVKTATTSARYPRITIILVILISVGLLIGGIMTNFELRLDNEKLFTPMDSELIEFAEFNSDVFMYEPKKTTRRLLQQQQQLKPYRSRTTSDLLNQTDTWTNGTTITIDLDSQSLPDENNIGMEREIPTTSKPTTAPTSLPTLTPTGSPTVLPSVSPTAKETEKDDLAKATELWTSEENKRGNTGGGRVFSILVHANGDNVFTLQGMNKLFELMEYMWAIPEYEQSCIGNDNSFTDYYGRRTCEIRGATRFWNHNRTLYEEQVSTEEDLYNAADDTFYPDGGFVDLPFVVAQPEYDPNGRPIAGKAFFVWVYLKVHGGLTTCTPVECAVVSRFKDLAAEWAADDSHSFILEFTAPYSFVDEVLNAVMGDLPLLPVVFGIMCVFTSAIFFKCSFVYSRSLLGIGAVFTVCLSIMTGYGVMFLAGKGMNRLQSSEKQHLSNANNTAHLFPPPYRGPCYRDDKSPCFYCPRYWFG